jgi:hypothetical protein
MLEVVWRGSELAVIIMSWFEPAIILKASMTTLPLTLCTGSTTTATCRVRVRVGVRMSCVICHMSYVIEESGCASRNGMIRGREAGVRGQEGKQGFGKEGSEGREEGRAGGGGGGEGRGQRAEAEGGVCTYCARVELLKRGLCVHIHARKPAAETRMGVVPAHYHLRPSCLLEHV